MIRRYHYTTTPVEGRACNQPVLDVDYKPRGGMWYSIGNAWLRWCFDNWTVPTLVYEVEIDERRVFRMDEGNARAFMERFGVDTGRFCPQVHWGLVANAYAGFEMAIESPGALRFFEERRDIGWIRTFDVPSGCVWDLSAARFVRLVAGRIVTPPGPASRPTTTTASPT